jgi:hypothetical protein
MIISSGGSYGGCYFDNNNSLKVLIMQGLQIIEVA